MSAKFSAEFERNIQRVSIVFVGMLFLILAVVFAMRHEHTRIVDKWLDAHCNLVETYDGETLHARLLVCDTYPPSSRQRVMS